MPTVQNCRILHPLIDIAITYQQRNQMKTHTFSTGHAIFQPVNCLCIRSDAQSKILNRNPACNTIVFNLNPKYLLDIKPSTSNHLWKFLCVTDSNEKQRKRKKKLILLSSYKLIKLSLYVIWASYSTHIFWNNINWRFQYVKQKYLMSQNMFCL